MKNKYPENIAKYFLLISANVSLDLGGGKPLEARPSFDTTPDISLQYKLGEGNYGAPQAISELAANSFDARVADEKVEIQIRLHSTHIEIEDNGRGMSLQVLGQALTLGASTSISKNQARKGLFGLGLKVACASMGRKYVIITKDLDSSRTFTAEVDLEDLMLNDSGNWKIVPYEMSEEESKAFFGEKASGTIVRIEKLKPGVKGFVSNPGTLHKKLLETYGAHLKSGDKIRIGDNDIEPRNPKLVSKYTLNIDVTIDVPSTGKQIKIQGWGGILPEFRNAGDYGFHLFRNQQLIVSHLKSPWLRPHNTLSRVVGELEIQGIPTNFSKDGFDVNSEEWELASDRMIEIVKPLAKQSRDMSSIRKKPDTEKAINEEFVKLVGLFPEVTIVHPEELTAVTKEKKDKKPTKPGDEEEPYEPEMEDTGGGSKVKVSPNVITLGASQITLEVQVEAVGEEETLLWDYIFDEENSQLLTVINSDSSVYRKSKDATLFAVLASADSLMSFLIGEWGQSFDDAIQIRNRWISIGFGDGGTDGSGR